MIYAHITATGPATEGQVWSGPSRKAIIQVNAALTGTLTILDTAQGTAGTAAIITNPTVGSKYEYWGFQNGVRIIPSATCDVTVSVDLSRSGV